MLIKRIVDVINQTMKVMEVYMKNAGENIKVMASFLFVLQLLVAGIWLIIVLLQYFSSPITHGSETTSILLAILYPACLILESLAVFFLMYGFGQLVENSDILVENQRRQCIDSEFKDLKKTFNKEEI